jgi:hypothetical protein
MKTESKAKYQEKAGDQLTDKADKNVPEKWMRNTVTGII